MLEFQNQACIYSQIFILQSQKANFRCPNNSQAHFVCINPQCQLLGLICNNSSCQCLDKHFKCLYIQLNNFFDIIGEHQKPIPQNFKKSFSAVHQIIDEMIEQLSQIKRKIDLQEKYFRLKKPELAFMELIDQHNIEKICSQICGKITSELKKSLQKDINFAIESHQKILQTFKLKKPEFNSLIKYIEESYMKYEVNKGFLGDSDIISLGYQKEMMHKWLSETLKKNDFSSKLLYRASEHKFSSCKFHKFCDGFENTLVIAKTEFNKIIGGFTPNKWHCGKSWVNDTTGKTFLFSLSLKEKYKCIDPNRSIYCSQYSGPAFGSFDLQLSDNCYNNRYSSANFPVSYNLLVDGKSKYMTNESSQVLQNWNMFSGAKNDHKFKVKQYEVYEIKGRRKGS